MTDIVTPELEQYCHEMTGQESAALQALAQATRDRTPLSG